MKKKLDTYKKKERTLFLNLILEFIFVIPFLVSIFLSNSIVIRANCLRNVSQTLAVLFSWLVIRKVSKGKTLLYNYGYGKSEAFSSLFVAITVTISIFVIMFNAYLKIINPTPVTGKKGILISLVFMIIAVSLSVMLWIKYLRLSRNEHSPVLEGQRKLYKLNFFSSFSAFIALILGFSLRKFAWASYLDPAGSIVLCGFMAYTAYGIFNMSMSNLMDKTLEESLQMIILQILAKHFDDYTLFHKIESRRSGSEIYINLFLSFEKKDTFEKVMMNINGIKLDLEKAINRSHVSIIPVF